VSPRHPTPGDVGGFAIRSKARHGAGACSRTPMANPRME
jgi:hypothetical protein